MQELLKKKAEIDRLYNEAKNMELTVAAAATETIEKALANLDDLIDQVGDSIGRFRAGINGWVVVRCTDATHNERTLQFDPSRVPPVMFMKRNGRWMHGSLSVNELQCVAEMIMFYWPRFMNAVKTEMEKSIKQDMQTKVDEVGRMIEFLKKAENFTV